MTNVKLNHALICDQVIVDTSGKISIIGMFNRINTKNTPVVHGKFAIVINTSGNPGESYLEKIEIINLQDDKSIASVEGKIEFKSAGINNFFGNFVNILFPVFGKYWIKVSINGDPITDPDKNYVLVEKNI
jgi:hypothetical protein